MMLMTYSTSDHEEKQIAALTRSHYVHLLPDMKLHLAELAHYT